MTEPLPPRSKIARVLFGLLAYVSLGIGLVAIVVPGLPTTEFILLAACCHPKLAALECLAGQSSAVRPYSQ